MRAIARKIDPATGERSFDRARRSWARALSPELAIVQNVLRTPLGSAARDRTYGVEAIDNAAPNAAAMWRLAVARALKRWVDNGTLRDVTVASRVQALPGGGATLVYTVTFKGRDGRTQTTPEAAR
jgi:phage baseplate assembly protein W